ncbi:MAG TPA: hypothetical protein VK934_03315 [Fimbriimonas sp.]|nr:hypothetical protein [Fimbriimonas sp.]
MKTLTLCEKAGMANMQVDLDDQETVDIYVTLLAANQVEAGMLAEARGKAMRAEFFPRPATLLQACVPIRDRIHVERERERMRRLVPAVDEEGRHWMASPEHVVNGRLLAKDVAVELGAIRFSSLPRLPEVLEGMPETKDLSGGEEDFSEEETECN